MSKPAYLLFIFIHFFASFNFELDLIPVNTGITAGSNLTPGPGRQIQVDTSESARPKLVQNWFEILIQAFRLLALVSNFT